MALAGSLSKPGERLWTKHVQPNTFGETWYNGSWGKIMEWGICFSREEEGILFIRKQAVRTASPQWCAGTLVFNIRERAVSRRWRFFLSAMLFCCGVWGNVDWCKISFEDKNEDKWWEKYSLALSLLKILMVLPNWFSISLSQLTRSLNCSVTFNANSFVIQEHGTGRLIGEGRESRGLYYLESSFLCPVLQLQSPSFCMIVWVTQV